MWSLLIACAVPAPVVEAIPDPEPLAVPVVEVDPYGDAMGKLEEDRVILAARKRTPELRQEARARLTAAIRSDLIPHWLGTPWTFEGMSEVPGHGTIACGYFVSTVLEDAALEVERVKLAQQMSEYIVLTFSNPKQVQRFRKGDVNAVVDAIEEEEPGVYVVGLDFHTGFLIRSEDKVEFCHSSWVGAEGVVCNDPRTDPAFASEYHVFGPVLEDQVIDRWLAGESFPTYTKG